MKRASWVIPVMADLKILSLQARVDSLTLEDSRSIMNRSDENLMDENQNVSFACGIGNLLTENYNPQKYIFLTQ